MRAAVVGAEEVGEAVVGDIVGPAVVGAAVGALVVVGDTVVVRGTVGENVSPGPVGV